MREMSKFEYSERISKERTAGRVDDAIKFALQAKEKYPKENIFEKFLGDLYFQNKNYELAGTAYICFLKKIGNKMQYLKHFAHFLQKYSEVSEHKVIAEYCHKVEKNLDSMDIDSVAVPGICEMLAGYIDFPEIELFQNDDCFRKAVECHRELEKSCRIYILYHKVLLADHSEKNKRIDKYIVSSMEKREQYKEALQLIEEVLNYDKDQVAVRTLFRICRKLGDYSSAERYLLRHPEIKKRENFNILYELVFYYSKIGDTEERDEALKKIEKCGNSSIPIMRTLYNFYLQFGMLDKAVEAANRISVLEQHNKNQKSETKEQEDAAALALLAFIQAMSEELERSRRLISMSEILKGFSHELGQPVTNIRYGVQLYQMKMERGVNTEAELNELFHDILSQTFRIKNLLSRFSPVVSEKENMTEFSVAEEIEDVFKDFALRLEKEKIEWRVEGTADFVLCGDRVKFNQIFYNLIGNSIYAIKEKKTEGEIEVHLEDAEDFHKIIFEDDGVGIADEYSGKIFDPFFTTKDHSWDSDGGGEGLGLYIVWNIVQMFYGNIKLDKQYRDGARFIIEIPKRKGKRKDE